jgi:hypothetical protein
MEEKERWEQTGAYVRKQNYPFREAVMVNNAGHGDDQAYSCWIEGVCFRMWEAGLEVDAYRLWLTDPLPLEGGWCTQEEFNAHMIGLSIDKELEDVEDEDADTLPGVDCVL